MVDFTKKISKRIKRISYYTKGYDAALDVGCDHGYTLYYSLINGYINHGIGTENKISPFNNAKKNLSKLDVKLYLTNGIDNVNDNYDCIIMSGLGVDLMIEIINKQIIKKPLILCPNNKIEKLRSFLFNNGYIIKDEEVVYDTFYYVIIHAIPNTIKTPYTQDDILFGPILKTNKDSLDYYNHLLNINNNILNAIKKDINKETLIKNYIISLQNLINYLSNKI